MVSRDHFRPSAFGWLLLGAFLASLVVLPYQRWLQPEPYKNVQVHKVEPRGDHVIIEASFEKIGCLYQRMVVVGQALGKSSILPWKPLDAPRGDRIAGGHTFRIQVDTGRLSFEELEIRTRHLCNNETVDRVFAHIDLPWKNDSRKETDEATRTAL